MMSLWLTQIAAVMRLEIKKSFFARRGLWIYLLALAPVILFSLVAFFTRNFHAFSPEPPPNSRLLTDADLDSIQGDMLRGQIIAKLGPAAISRKRTLQTFDDDGNKITVDREELTYFARNRTVTYELQDGALKLTISRDRMGFQKALYDFADVFEFFFIRLAVFFGCLGIFMNLFRGEMIDKSLHYYLLAPIRREVLLLGKFLAGLVAASVIFTLSAALQIAALLSAFDGNTLARYFNDESGMTQVLAYLGVTVLACVGYGAVFLGAGLLFRNPIFPAAAILIWEAANPLLPALLKKFSVIYYLKSLCPLPVSSQPGMPALFKLLVTNGDPISSYVAVFGLLAFAAVVLWVSALKVRRLEINYTTE